MIDYSSVKLEQLSVHHIGNKTNSEDIKLSKSSLDISDERLTALLVRYFLTPFSVPEFYSFTFSNDDFNLNPLYQFSTDLFEDKKSFHKNSIHVAKHLYEVSTHPQIKAGDLFVVRFSNLKLNDEYVDAIGIFKSENRQSFLKLNASDFELNYDDGIDIEKLDKGCLIFNTDQERGYKVCIVDRSNKSVEAQFWKDNFLMLKPCHDDYHQTKDFMSIARGFVTEQLAEEFEASKADQIDLLNRSMQYFKTRDSFNKQEFEKEVFQDPEIIKSFRQYDDTFRMNNSIDPEDSFEISVNAVKKQARVFKSILKLDKNFHVYIHGDRNLIEKGVDSDGRKFYKIYFEKEE